MSSGNAVAFALSLLAGLAGSVQVAVMGRFGERIGVLQALAFSAVVTAAIATAALLVVRRSLGGFADAAAAPPWLWIGGLAGALIVFTITLAAPRIGAFATIGLFLAGQLTMGAVVDRFGLFGLERIPLAWPRVVGLVFLATGAVLTLRK